jgi:hypothetical protein
MFEAAPGYCVGAIRSLDVAPTIVFPSPSTV